MTEILHCASCNKPILCQLTNISLDRFGENIHLKYTVHLFFLYRNYPDCRHHNPKLSLSRTSLVHSLILVLPCAASAFALLHVAPHGWLLSWVELNNCCNFWSVCCVVVQVQVANNSREPVSLSFSLSLLYEPSLSLRLENQPKDFCLSSVGLSCLPPRLVLFANIKSCVRQLHLIWPKIWPA